MVFLGIVTVVLIGVWGYVFGVMLGLFEADH